MARSSKQPTRGKLVAFVSILCLTLVVAIELIFFVGLSLRDGRLRTWSDWQREREAETARFGAADRFDYPELRQFGAGREDVLHPYIGYVGDPTKRAGIHELGFKTAVDPIQKRSDDRLIVGVVGGSVAEGFAGLAPTLLPPVLDGIPALGDRELVVVNLASGGVKQPQQLASLTYALALGAEFDVVINIDGFNDVALHEFENATRGVHPAFPRVWIVFVDPIPDPVLLQALGEQEYLESEMIALAGLHTRRPFRYSTVWNAVWDLRRRRLLDDYAAAVARVSEHQRRSAEIVDRERPAPYRVTGPRVHFDSRAEMYRYLAELWSNASIQLDRLCRANGTLYLHFLQPNQYVPGSKPMGAAERRVAINEEQLYRPGVETGYPLLLHAGSRLRQAGVRFTDLTRLFVSVEDPIYTDDCCHFGREGYEIFTRHAGQVLGESWSGRPGGGG